MISTITLVIVRNLEIYFWRKFLLQENAFAERFDLFPCLPIPILIPISWTPETLQGVSLIELWGNLIICWSVLIYPCYWCIYTVNNTGEERFCCPGHFTWFHSITGHRHPNEKPFCPIKAKFFIKTLIYEEVYTSIQTKTIV